MELSPWKIYSILESYWVFPKITSHYSTVWRLIVNNMKAMTLFVPDIPFYDILRISSPILLWIQRCILCRERQLWKKQERRVAEKRIFHVLMLNMMLLMNKIRYVLSGETFCTTIPSSGRDSWWWSTLMNFGKSPHDAARDRKLLRRRQDPEEIIEAHHRHFVIRNRSRHHLLKSSCLSKTSDPIYI